MFGVACRNNIGLNIQSFWDGDLGYRFEIILRSFDMSKMEVLGKDIK